LQSLRDLVHLYFLSKAWLDRAVPALWAARRLVREGAATAKAVALHAICSGLQRAGVKRARHAVRSIRAAIDQRLQVHRRDCAVAFYSGLEFHQYRVASAMTVKNLFACQADLYRPVQQQRRFRHHDLVLKGIALSAEASAVRSRDHAN